MQDPQQLAVIAEQTGLALPNREQVRTVIARATDMAQELKQIIDSLHLSVAIGGSHHVKVEAWQTVGRFCGYTVCTEAIPPDGPGRKGFAKVIRLSDGMVVSTATAECGSEGDEAWLDRSSQDQASMAQTRAAGKAFRNVLSWIIVLAGYEATPAEEMAGSKPPPGAPLDKYFCAEHNTVWFKKGKMRNFAHPIGDTGQWCDMPAEAPSRPAQPSSPAGRTKQPPAPEKPAAGTSQTDAAALFPGENKDAVFETAAWFAEQTQGQGWTRRQMREWIGLGMEAALEPLLARWVSAGHSYQEAVQLCHAGAAGLSAHVNREERENGDDRP